MTISKIDAFASRFDSQDSIGGLEIVGGSSVNPFENTIAVGALEIVGVDIALGLEFDAGAAMSSARATAKALTPAHTPSDWDKGASAVRSVTDSPITHAAIAAVAAVVPVGTVVAGVAEAAIGVAKIVTDVGPDIANFVGGIFGGGGPAYDPREVRKAVRWIAPIIAKARLGYPRAQRELVAVMFRANPAMRSAMNVTQLLARGIDKTEAAQIASGFESTQSAFWKETWKQAKKRAKSLKYPPPPKPIRIDIKKVNAQITKGAKVLSARAHTMAAKRKALSGVYVSRAGGLKRGNFVNSPLAKSGALGWVVLKSGQVVGGKFHEFR